MESKRRSHENRERLVAGWRARGLTQQEFADREVSVPPAPFRGLGLA